MIKLPEWPIPLGYKDIDLGLDRINQLLKNLGIDESILPPIVHIAGTNGKGSTLAFLKAFLEAAGYKVHAYTSPHLKYFNERIVLAGKMISDKFLKECLATCKEAAKDIPVTFFEGTTAAAFLAFTKVKADILLLETGLGGRLDATNVIEKPLLTIITPIAFDHMEFLGDTLEKIAAEKAAIMKSGILCVLAKQEAESLTPIYKEAKAKNCRLLLEGQNWRIEKTEDGFKYKAGDLDWRLPLPALTGEHQLHNAGTAITAAINLTNFNIDEKAIEKGLISAVWPGRLQEIKHGSLKKLLPKNFSLWLDGGHNPGGGKTIAEWLKSKPQKKYIVTGMLKDKDSVGFLNNFTGLTEELYAVPIEDEPKARKPQELAAIALQLGITAKEEGSIPAALKKISGLTEEPALILICGSLYLAGNVLLLNDN